MATVITGNSLLDTILLSLLTGGGVISLLTLWFDRLSKKRTDYTNISNQRIARFSEAQPYYAQLASFYNALSSELSRRLYKNEELDYELCIYFICNILYLFYKFHNKIGLVQLDNAYVEHVIWELLLTVHSKITDSKLHNRIKYRDIYRLRALIDENTTYESFYKAIKSDKKEVYDVADKWLREIGETGGLIDFEQKSRWYSNLIYVEMTIMYEIYYGKQHIQQFFKDKPYISKDLIFYLQYNHPQYYNRISKLKLIESDFS